MPLAPRLEVRRQCLLLLAILAAVQTDRGVLSAEWQPAASLNPVSIFATVIDGQGADVPAHGPEDFTLLIDGRPRPFSSGATHRPVAALVLVDASTSTTLFFDVMRHAAERFAARLGSDDVLRACVFSDLIACGASFSSDRDEFAKPLRAPDLGNGARLFDALSGGIDDLARIERRRRVIVVFTADDDIRSRTRFRDLVAAAHEQDVMVYAVGLHGFLAADDFDDDDTPLAPTEDRRLRKLVEETGGTYVEVDRPSRALAAASAVARELPEQHLLLLASDVVDRGLHDVTVRLTAGHDRVRARKHYYIAKTNP